jgi:hypothetical protein
MTSNEPRIETKGTHFELTCHLKASRCKLYRTQSTALNPFVTKTFIESCRSTATLNMSGIWGTSKLNEGLMYQVSQASFIKFPPFLLKISCGKHSANQIAAASLNMNGICQTSNLSEGLKY